MKISRLRKSPATGQLFGGGVVSFLLSVQFLCRFHRTNALSYSVPFALTREFSAEHKESLMKSFEDVVQSTDFLFKTDSCKNGECCVPLFGDDVKVKFGPHKSMTSSSAPTEYVLRMDGETLEESDFGWVCAKFFECKDSFPGLAIADLRTTVAAHFNEQPPHPGYDARATAVKSKNDLDHLLDDSALFELKDKGFVVVDSELKTSKFSNEKLGDFVVGSTGQDEYRTDTVSFLDHKDAVSCGVEKQFNTLMGVANHLNENFEFSPSWHEPITPGTTDRPLSNPKHLQMAEYGMGDFYSAHSDNSWAEPGTRLNYRHYTCILYCNEGWTADDGGALRLYLDSAELMIPADAKKKCKHVDVVPANGRLLVFDSALVHSVEKVTQSKTPRQALTLWILRPEDSGARGEVYYTGE